jgi:cell wall assembly regulator SMI1
MSSPKLELEIKRLEEILHAQGRKLQLDIGASKEAIAAVEAEVGLSFDEQLKAFYTLSNGSQGDRWFALMCEDLTTSLTFLSLEEALQNWSLHDSVIYQDHQDRDARIIPGYLAHRLWFPFAEANGGAISLQYDADPSPAGKYGQIIFYQQDHDAIYYVAESFLDFFQRSNDVLAAKPDQLHLLY